MINFFLKITLPIAVAMVTLVSCLNETNDTVQLKELETLSESETAKIENFEKELLQGENKKLTRSAQDCLHLYGYVTIVYHGEDSIFVNKLWEYYKNDIDSMGHFLVLDGKLRVYFPLRDAIAKIGFATLHSDSLGFIDKCQSANPMRIKVTGRSKTENSVYTRFVQPYSPEKAYYSEHSLIFNMGERDLCCKKKSIKRLKTMAESMDNRVSCIQNHGGKNCTVAFGIKCERCILKKDRCMDYNGLGTDCSGSHLFFAGSDCSIAMAKGHCWNEIMN